MPKPKHAKTTSWTASQVVAHNLTRARELRRLTQAEVAERLTRFTDSTWTQTTVAQAEGSVTGNRVRQFNANELVAMARAFDLPLPYFFMPPESVERRFATADTGDLPWEYLLLLVWGHQENYPILADRAAAWAHSSAVLRVPSEDLLDRPSPGILGDLERDRERYGPDDMLAAAFYGLARRRMRGSMQPGKEVESLVASLRGLADALAAFDNYRPGTFLDTEDIAGRTSDKKGKGQR